MLSMVPRSLPVSSIIRISSSVTASPCSLGSIWKSRSSPFVDFVKIQTNGANTQETNFSVPDIPSAIFSAFFIASRFGTSSPKTMLKYERISVMTNTQMEFSVLSEMPTPSPTSHFTSGSAKLSAAYALPRSPASVIATWIVERNLDGFLVRESSLFAFLSPSSDSFSSFASLVEMTAISALAKTAFKKISTICNIIAPIMVLLCFLFSSSHC